MSKYCKDCETIKPMTDYYRAGKSWQVRCKPCHNKYREGIRQKKPIIARVNPFHKLPKETQDEVLLYYGTMPLTTLAKRVNINVQRMYGWRKRGLLVPMV